MPEFVDKSNYVAPSNELESQLCAIWEEVLGLERVGITDDFFRIGGDSISAMQIAHKVSQSFEMHVSVVDSFSYKTIQQLGVMLKNHNQFIAIPCIAKTHPALSYAQERLWFIEEYEGGSNAYHMPMLLELDAEVDESSFEQSLQSIVVRHEVLRTVLGRDDSGIGYQEVLDAALEIEFRNYNGADEFKAQLAEDINSPFDLMKSYPIRVVFYRANSEAHETSKRYVLINIHHIAFDGWSANIFIRELSAYYEHYAKGSALKLKDLSIQYKDYAEWQREYLQEGVLERQSRYWQDQLKGFETLMFPTDKPRPSRIDYSGGNVSFNLGRELSSDLKALAKERGCTLYTVLLSGFYILLHKYTGQLDLIVGTPVANRDYAQLEGLIGFFVNSLGIRAQIESEQRGADLIEQVHKTLVEGQRHQDLPFERLVELLGVDQDQSRHPIFQVMFGLQDISVGDTKYFKIKERGAHYEVAKFDLSLFLKEAEGGLVGAFSYALSLFDVETIERLACHYKVVLTQLVEDLDKPVQSYEVLSREEYQRIVYEWNETDRDYPRDKTIYELFEEQALRVPDKVALIYEGEELTYKELDERTNQLARHIRKCYRHGIGKELEADTLIALYLERSLEMVIGLLGVLKSGGAYVPISPEYPEERVKYILEDTGAEVLLLQSHLVESVKEVTEGIELIALDEGSYREEDVRSLERRSGPDDLAYVIYTSGTTGKPKGVMQLHSNVMRLFTATEDLFHFTAEDIWTLYHSYIFDFSVWEVCGPLFYGGKLVIPSQDQVKDIAKFHQLCVTHNVSILNQTPNAFYQFSDIAAQSQDLLSSLRYIFLGGEALNSKQLLTWWEYCNENGLTSELVNMYGITETTVHVTFKVLSADEKVQSNIGKPIGDLTAYILDGAGMPVSIGVVGELYIGGAGLARGYLNREELTLERFVPNVFATETDKEKGYGRLYRTGDLVRWLPDGNIEYIGRNDFQVKIRGFRIELGEIEEALSSYEGIKQVSVLARERDSDVGSSGKYLVGYYVSPEAIDSDELFRHTSRILPEYMVPSAFVHMESFPLTENGKLERGKLPLPEFVDKTSYVAPSNELESQLCAIWEEVLGLERVGITDDFFRIGGDSILSIQLASRLRGLALSCSVRDVFDYRTIRRLAQYLIENTEVLAITAEQGVLEGDFGLLPIQSWFFDQVLIGRFDYYQHWNQSFLIRVPELEVKRLEKAIAELVMQHDSLRIMYPHWQHDSQQRYLKAVDIPLLKVLDVSQLDDFSISEELSQWQSIFNIESGPLWGVGYLHGYKDGSARVHFAFHHLIIDSVSWRIIIEDLKNLYEGKFLGEKSSSYRQWVDVVSLYADDHISELDYWQKQHVTLPDYKQYYPSQPERHSHSFRLGVAVTQRILQQSSDAYHTEINDLLLTALGYSLQSWQGDAIQGITLEGHGREDIAQSIDVSRTVGWFTIKYPVTLRLKDDLGSSIKQIKEDLRRIPNKGIGYGAFFYKEGRPFKELILPPISFNYLGQFDTAEALWQLASEGSGTSIDAKNKDCDLISINGMVVERQLGFTVTTQLGETVTTELAQIFKAQLELIADHCVAKVIAFEQQYTPSDFKTVQLSQILLDRIQEEARKTGNKVEAIYPANSLQQGFIYHVLSQPDDDAYRVQLLFDYEQPLNVETYKKAWELAIETYPVLRMAFNWEEDLIQVIYKRGLCEYHYFDISHLDEQSKKDKAIDELQKRDRTEAFDLSKPSLLRLYVIKQNDRHYSILKSVHHSISDGWSGPILVGKVHAYYEQLQLKRAVTIEVDSAYMLTQEYYYGHRKEMAQYWERRASSLSECNDLNPLLSKTIDLDQVKNIQDPIETSLIISGEQYKKLKVLVQEVGVTINVLLQFAWHKLIQIHTQDSQTVVGTTISGRDIAVTGVDASVGLYINTLPLVVDWDNGNTVQSQLQAIHQEITELNSHGFVHLSGLQSEGRRLFHSIVAFENYPGLEGKDGKGLKGENEKLVQVSRQSIEKLDYPLGLIAYESKNELYILLKHDREMLTYDLAEVHLNRLKLILGSLPEKLNSSHQNISLLTKEEYQRIVYEWNETDRDYPRDKTIYELFEEQALRVPDKVALIYEGEELTYKELDERTNQLARHIRKCYRHGIGKELEADTLIALYLERSLEMVIGLLGVLKSGGAYVPISPEYPEERVKYILEDTGAEVLLLQSHLVESVKEVTEGIELIALDEGSYREEDVRSLERRSGPDDLAYVIYTSGTTGKPKGVMITQKAFCSLLFAFENQKICFHDKTLLSLTHYAFDIFGLEYGLPLITGNTIILSEPNTFKTDFCRYRGHIRIIQQTPTTLALLLQEMTVPETPIDMLCLVGGEAISAITMEQLKKYFKRVVNVYGPTETTIWSLAYLSMTGNCYVGKAIQNTRVYILDGAGMPVSIGVVGELYIGGAGLARGYLNREELTLERFVPNVFATETDKEKGYGRLYRTGDLVRWLPDGNIEYIGRNDFQVKIRGFRIELGEIEEALSSYEGIKQVSVLARERDSDVGSGGKYLVGYYVSPEAIDSDELFRHISRILPEYMVPSAFVHMESFPLTENGKLERGKLPLPEFVDKTSYVAPSNELESQLCAIWEEVLGLERVGITDDFFRIGGNSILAIKLTYQISRKLDLELHVVEVLTNKTVLKLASILQGNVGLSDFEF